MRGIRCRVSSSDKNELFTNCVFCDDRKQRLGLNIKTGQAHCFNCEFKSKKHGLKLVLRRLGDSSNVGTGDEGTEERKPITRLPSEFVLLSTCRRVDLYAEALDYLERRGIRDSQIANKGGL